MTAKGVVGMHVQTMMIINKMRVRFADFVKTEHFLLRQRERGVSDKELSIALAKIESCEGSQLLVVSRLLIRKCSNIKCQELFIKIDGKILITCFYCDFQEYLNAKNNENYFLITP